MQGEITAQNMEHIAQLICSAVCWTSAGPIRKISICKISLLWDFKLLVPAKNGNVVTENYPIRQFLSYTPSDFSGGVASVAGGHGYRVHDVSETIFSEFSGSYA